MAFESASLALPRLPPDAGADQVTAGLAHAGAAIVTNILDEAALGALNGELQPWFAQALAGEGPFFGRRTRRFSALLAKSEATWALAAHPLVIAVAEAVLKGGEARHCDAIQLNLTQAIQIDPGEPAQAPHRDDQLFPVTHTHELMLNAMWTLDAFTPENGATYILPGSHMWPRDRSPDPSLAESAAAPAGSIIFWLGSTLHGGGANHAANPRRGLTFSYSAAWLAQAEKLLLTTPPDLVRRMPERLQRLVGYQIHRPNLGWVEERCPREWLEGRVGSLAAAQDHLTPEQDARVRAFCDLRRHA